MGERLRIVRETVGNEVVIGVDFHGWVDKSVAKCLIAALESHSPFFIEESVLSAQNNALPYIAQHATTSVATSG
nr:enolase C-terminal domain-like protein [Saliphagus infecundisoli]